MTAVAMPLYRFDVWLQDGPGVATADLSMLDGHVTAIVAEPLSMEVAHRGRSYERLDGDA
jgi:hypothetical protein